MSFWGELRRRNVVKVVVAYAIVAWLLIQVASTLLPIFRAPDWVLPVVVMLLAMGLVLAAFFSWAYELTPEGLVPTEAVPLAQSQTRATGRKIDFAIIGFLVVALGYMVFDRYVLDETQAGAVANVAGQDQAQARSTAAADAGAGAGAGAAAAGRAGDTAADNVRRRLPKSVAVLPFANMSPDPNDAYFADGLHEEILNQLVKLSDLSVISRTTMMQYANQNKSPPEIADELNVETVMEGSVRYAGNRIRVTVQLIDPVTDLHLISETYNADLSNLDQIFDIQSDIAMRVANALQAEFSPEEQSRIEQIPTRSPEAWSEYLAARAFHSRYVPANFLLAFDRINRALELDPDFGMAWAEKARVYADAVPYFPARSDEFWAIADEALARALETGQAFAEVHANAAPILAARGRWLDAEAEVERAVELGVDPSQVAGLFTPRIGVGRASPALAEFWRQYTDLDPLNPAISFWVIAALDAVGDPEGALAEFERGRTLFDENWVGYSNAFATLLGLGDHERAKEIGALVRDNAVLDQVLGDFDRPDAALSTLRDLYASADYADLQSRQMISNLAAYFGDDALAIRAMRDYLRQFAVSAYLWRPVFAAARRTEDFKALARDFGFVDYWRVYGWPDSCEPVGAQDFVCH